MAKGRVWTEAQKQKAAADANAITAQKNANEATRQKERADIFFGLLLHLLPLWHC